MSGGQDEIPDFLKGRQSSHGQQEEPEIEEALMQGIDMLGQNQQQLGAAHAITQQALMFQFNLLINAFLEDRGAKKAYGEAMARILNGEDPQQVQEDLKQELAKPSIVTPGV